MLETQSTSIPHVRNERKRVAPRTRVGTLWFFFPSKVMRLQRMFLSSLKSLSQKKLIPQLRSLTQIKHNSLFGTERSLLRIRTKSKQQPMMCKPLCHPMTSRKITEGGRVGGKKNKTVQYKISGVRLRWKMTRNEIQNSWSLVLEGVCCVWIALGKQTSRPTEITGWSYVPEWLRH